MTPAFFHSGDDVCWQGDPRTPLNAGDLDYLARVYRDECMSALAAGDDPAFEVAKGLLSELFKAIGERNAWKACASAPRQSIGRTA